MLEKHKIVVAARANGFRADIGYYISFNELETTVGVVADAIRKGDSRRPDRHAFDRYFGVSFSSLPPAPSVST